MEGEIAGFEMNGSISADGVTMRRLSDSFGPSWMQEQEANGRIFLSARCHLWIRAIDYR
jgi:hypothetical protein